MNHSTEPTPWPPLTEAHVEMHWSLAVRFLGDFVRAVPAHVIAGITMVWPDLGAALGHARIVQEAQEGRSRRPEPPADSACAAPDHRGRCPDGRPVAFDAMRQTPLAE